MSSFPPVKERMLVRERINKLLEGIFEEEASFVLEQPGIEQSLKELYMENTFIDYDEAAGIYKNMPFCWIF
jgi:hypothetical protein